jgi:hypothetical protein
LVRCEAESFFAMPYTMLFQRPHSNLACFSAVLYLQSDKIRLEQRCVRLPIQPFSMITSSPAMTSC